MSDEMMNPADFQALMVERLRADVGKLIPDEQLTKLVEQAIQTMFFTRRIEKQTYGRDIQHDSWWEEEVAKQFRSQIGAFTTTYLSEHRAQLEATISSALIKALPEILATIVVGILNNSISNISLTITEPITQALREHNMLR